MNDVDTTAKDRIRGAALEGCISRMARGDGAALEELYRCARGPVYGYALSILKNVQDAEDVLHDCFVAVYSGAGSYRPGGRPMAWIITIAKNLCLSRLRERRRGACAPPEDYEPRLQGREGLGTEDRLLLAACLERLTEGERKAVILHAAGLKHREIAALMDIPLSTALSKYSRALKKLRRSMTEGEEQT